jgi:transposase
MPRAGLPEETKQAIRELVADGISNREVARQLGVGAATVSRIASDLTPEADRSRMRKVAAAGAALEKARSRWDAAARIELLNKGFDALDRLAGNLRTVKAAKDWATATGILIDKRRLEDGESDGSAPAAVIQIQAIDYRIAIAALAPEDASGPVGHLPAPGEGQGAGDGETLG